MERIKLMALAKIVKITRENIGQICDSKFIQRINYYIFKNGNKLKETDKQELAQKIVVRIYRNLLRKIDQRVEQKRKPILKIKAGRFVNYVNKCALNEIIQYMRCLDKEQYRKVYFSEALDYNRPIEEINRNLGYSGNQVSEQIIAGEFVSDNGNRYMHIDKDKIKGNGHKSKRRISYLRNILPRLDSTPTAKLNCQDKYNNSMAAVEEEIEMESLMKCLGKYLDKDEINVISHIYKGTIHKEIFDKVFSNTHKNVSIVAKKLFKIRDKVEKCPELKNVLMNSLCS